MPQDTRFRYRIFYLDTAVNAEEHAWIGSVFRIRRASSSTAQIRVAFEQRDETAIPMVRGEGFSRLPFNRVYVSWDAQPGQWVEVMTYVGGDAEVFLQPDFADINIASQAAPLDVKQAEKLMVYDATKAAVFLQGTGTVGNLLIYTVPANTQFVIQNAQLTGNGQLVRLGIVDATGTSYTISPIAVMCARASGVPVNDFAGYVMQAGQKIYFYQDIAGGSYAIAGMERPV